MADSLNVQVQDGSVLIEDRQRNLSVFVLTRPLHITCPWCKERLRFHSQEQVDMFQKHLDWHATESATLKAREATLIATVNAAWAGTVAAITAERDELAKKVAQLEAAAKNPQGE